MAIAVLLDEISDEGSKDIQNALVLLWALEVDQRSSRCRCAVAGWNCLDRHGLSGLRQEFQCRCHSVKRTDMGLKYFYKDA